MKNIIFIIFSLYQISIVAQPNCEAYKYFGDTLKYKACNKAMEAKGHYQFSKEYQMAFDAAIKIDSTFDYAYYAKSIAYLKSGDFITWKTLIDKAVELNPVEYLGYRGWCRYQFFRDYEGAIADIEKLESISKADIGHSKNGVYHLNIAKALCYKAIGQIEKALLIIEKQIKINEAENFIGAYDYLHLGVLYLETNKIELAIAAFKKQSAHNPLAENQYYFAKALKTLGKTNDYKTSLQKAKELYQKDIKMFDFYSTPMDKIYLETIENEIIITSTK